MKSAQLMVLLMINLFSWACGKSQNQLKTNQLHEMLRTAQPILLDSREPKEYAVSHLQNARFVGYNQFSTDSLQGIKPTDTIVVYCSVGYRSGKIQEKLKAMGYINVFNLDGGIFDWVNSGFPVYDKNGKTDRIHAYDKLWGTKVKKGIKVYD